MSGVNIHEYLDVLLFVIVIKPVTPDASTSGLANLVGVLLG